MVRIVPTLGKLKWVVVSSSMGMMMENDRVIAATPATSSIVFFWWRRVLMRESSGFWAVRGMAFLSKAGVLIGFGPIKICFFGWIFAFLFRA